VHFRIGAASSSCLGLLAACIGVCGRDAPSPMLAAPTDASQKLHLITAGEPATAATGCLSSHDGYLRVRMRGARNLDIDWRDADMHCDGGPRPDARGVRLTFAGPEPRSARRLLFVFGIAATPGISSARNVPANVTVIFEGQRKLYSTAGDGKCTVDEYSEQPLSTATNPHQRRFSARGFCTDPALAIAGKSGLLLSRFDFAGQLDTAP
jgi:hypothetical protein